MSKTQILAARVSEVTPEMEFCAKREGLPVETIREKVGAGGWWYLRTSSTPLVRWNRCASALPPFFVNGHDTGGLNQES
jgi:thiamine biosynthesis protein ThiC